MYYSNKVIILPTILAFKLVFTLHCLWRLESVTLVLHLMPGNAFYIDTQVGSRYVSDKLGYPFGGKYILYTKDWQNWEFLHHTTIALM